VVIKDINKKRVKCVYCGKEIHIDRWAGVNKKGFICNNICCLMELSKENKDDKQ